MVTSDSSLFIMLCFMLSFILWGFLAYFTPVSAVGVMKLVFVLLLELTVA